MQPHIILLNGPAGVGKTAVAAHLARLVPGSVCVHGDDVRASAPADARVHLGPGSTYRAGAALAAAYLRMGATRFIFEYVFERGAHVDYFRDATPEGVPVHLITLWAPLEVIQAREAQRRDRRRLGLRVEECYRALEASLDQLGVLVSTTGLSADEVAAAVHALLIGQRHVSPNPGLPVG